MSHHYQSRCQSVQHCSEESESEYESESEEEQEPQPRGNACLISQRGGAGGACRPQPNLENYFAHLTEQYYSGLALEGHIGPTSSKPKPKQWDNRRVEYAQQNKYDLMHFSQDDRRVPTSSKPTTPKKEEQRGYAYYESNKLVNNGSVGHVRNNNNDLSYISREDCTITPGSKPKLNKGKMERGYAYDESVFDNTEHVGYRPKNWQVGYIIAPPSSKPKQNKGKMGSGYAFDECGFDTNRWVGYGP